MVGKAPSVSCGWADSEDDDDGKGRKEDGYFGCLLRFGHELRGALDDLDPALQGWETMEKGSAAAR